MRILLNTSRFAVVIMFPTNAVKLQDTYTKHIENKRPVILTTNIFSISAEELFVGNTTLLPYFAQGG